MLTNLAVREFKGRYKGSVLGFLWTMLTPLLMAVIYVFFLRLLAGRGVPLEEILIGVFAWQFTVQSVMTGMVCVTGNANLVKKVYFPRVVLPLATTLANTAGHALSVIVLLGLVIFLRRGEPAALAATVCAVPGVVVYHALFNLALALCVASANVFFRDTQHLVGLFLNAWFFLSPVMYNISILERWLESHPGPWMNLFMANPMAVIITAYRALILPDVSFPGGPGAAAGLLAPVFLLVLGWWIFERTQRFFPDVL